MLHNRLATEVRNHLSTIGPVPASSVSEPTTGGAGPRLVTPHPDLRAVPSLPPSSSRHGAFFPELLSITAHRCGAFFAEAAVLVLIFGILDRLLSRGRVELLWIAGTLAATLLLLAASVLTDLSARRWLSAH